MRRRYYTVTEILKHKATINIVTGGRNLGKSYAIASHGLTNSWDSKQPTFMLVFREDRQAKPSNVESYFADKPVSVITKGEYDTITAKANRIYFAKIDPESGKAKAGLMCGYYIALNVATLYKSQAFPTVTDMIYEEFTPEDGKYLPNEPERLMSLVSTVFRSRVGRLWLIGNLNSRINPYVREWSLTNHKKQEVDTIDDYYLPSENEDGEPIQVKIAVELAPSVGSQNSMIVGRSRRTINGGEYHCNVHPKLELKRNEYTMIYEVLLMNEGFDFVLQLLSNDNTGQLVLYGYPYTGNREIKRILSEVYDENPFHTVWFLKDSEIEQKMIELLGMKQIAFSDNLTGDELISTLKTLKASAL
ncbi:MAG: phage DNA encapsidation protein [Bacteroidaceae bacterium]|nr:phage DNA encapsidation protein [Bacteroidaceae bacterium]